MAKEFKQKKEAKKPKKSKSDKPISKYKSDK